MAEPDYAHSDQARKAREAKATALAAYIWDRGISASELTALAPDTRRKMARAAGINPPSSGETWTVVARMLGDKTAWAAANPDHPGSSPAHAEEKIMWVKPPVKPW